MECRNINGGKEMGNEGDENEILKRRISNHPLYGLLLETHLDCLKVGGVSDEFQSNETAYLKQHETNPNIATVRQPELDHFMEAYCFALGKLKEAIEEPQQKSMAFINNMHLQLSELTKTCPAESTTTLLVKARNDWLEREG
ncbi:homeobox protein knotted-1-like 1 [Ziziphus jujuba]|uniref:Homeobox protein knotted-1-like 1 n=1 Tax=Ziziphus jujuba TaxID=326968 RepID=A0ABM3IK40_ZIZJJ|nr:homeobox protein knotted-1-like 1 [Ziziphus jujuba]